MDSATLTPERNVVGLVGLGGMGLAVAHRLLSRGVPLLVFNRSIDRANALFGSGARVADSAADVGRHANSGITFTTLTDGEAVRSVLFGRNGLARGLSPGSLVIDLSTIGPDESRSIARRLAAGGVHFLDAPMGGSVDAATDGSLLLYVGGEEKDLDRARPMLDHLARKIEWMGPVGSGSSMKLVNNLLTIGYVALASEALSIAEGLGLDRSQVLEALLAGGARSTMLEAKARAFSEREYPTRFRLSLARKDLRLAERAANQVGRSSRITREIRRTYDEAVDAGEGDKDFSAVFETALRRRAAARRRSTARVEPAGTSRPDSQSPAVPGTLQDREKD